MIIKAIESITVRLSDKAHILQPGETIDLPPDKAKLLLERAPGRVRPLDVSALIQPSCVIKWQRVDGSTHSGLVDFLHTDADGHTWAFVIIGETWAAVNIKTMWKLHEESVNEEQASKRPDRGSTVEICETIRTV